MKAWTVRIALLLATIVASLVLVSQAAASPQPKDGDKQAVFGTITNVMVGTAGSGTISVQAQDKALQIDVRATTTVTLPGRAAEGIGGLRAGDGVAVLAVEESGKLVASSILVKPTRPTTYRHLTGVVLSGGSQLTLLDFNGNTVTVGTPASLADARMGDVASLIVGYSALVGELFVREAVPASKTLSALKDALRQAEQAGQTQRAADLKARIQDHITQELAVISKAAIAGVGVHDTLRAVLANLQEERRRDLASLSLPEPSLQMTGVIVARDTATSSYTILPDKGQPLNIAVNQQTKIELPTGAGAFQDLNLGNRVEVYYSLQNFAATRVRLVRQELGPDRLARLIPLAQRGEADGRVVLTLPNATPPSLQVRTAAGANLVLTVTPDTRVLFNETKIPLANLPLGQRVAVQYDPDTMTAIEVRVFGEEPGEALVSGVVSGIVRKAFEVSVTTSEGKLLVLKTGVTTLIERDGERVPIGAIQLGDLVRPVSRYKSASQELVALLLKGPGVAPIQGTVTGVTMEPNGDGYVTIVTLDLDFVTLRVPTNSRLDRGGSTITLKDVRVRDQVRSGTYNASIQEAVRLTLSP